MKKYYRGWISLPVEKYVPAVTDKAIAFTVDDGRWTDNGNRTLAWLPKSKIIIREPNEENNAEILIPTWLLQSRKIRFDNLLEIGGYNGENNIVEL